jgi:hypothetical protein
MTARHPASAESAAQRPSRRGARRLRVPAILAGCCAAIVAGGIILPSPDSATVAAPTGKASSMRKRILDAFGGKPKANEPQEFIAAPTPPRPDEIERLEKSARKLTMPPATQRLAMAPTGIPSWDEVKHLAQDAARKIVPGREEPAVDNAPIAEPMPTVLEVTSRSGIAEGNAPRPPANQRFNRLKSRVGQTLAAYQRRPLNTAQHTPWEVMHGFIAFGIPSKVRVGGPSGDPINSIGWMNSGGRCKGQVMLATEDERLVAMRGVGVQGHQAQYLAILAQCRVALNSPIQVEGKGFTVADLVEEEKLACLSGTELTFALIGLTHYLPTDAEWTARDGQIWTLERLVSEEIEQPIRGAPCGGTHRLFGLSYACQRRLRATGTLDGHYARADHFVRDYQRFALTKLQNPDGSFSTEWFKYPADREDDVDRKVQTTGHILEWLVGSLDQDQLYQSRVVSAVEFLSAALLREPSREWKLGPLGHALHALTIYQERVWGKVLPGGIAAYSGTMKAAPDVAKTAARIEMDRSEVPESLLR